MANYWTQETNDALKRYNESTDVKVKDAIFREHLLAPINKIVEVWCNKFGVPHLKSEVFAHTSLQCGKVLDYETSFAFLTTAAKNQVLITLKRSTYRAKHYTSDESLMATLEAPQTNVDQVVEDKFQKAIEFLHYVITNKRASPSDKTIAKHALKYIESREYTSNGVKIRGFINDYAREQGVSYEEARHKKGMLEKKYFLYKTGKKVFKNGSAKNLDLEKYKHSGMSIQEVCDATGCASITLTRKISMKYNLTLHQFLSKQ